MLQALLHSKLKDSFHDPHFSPSEDTLTSSVFGLLQYLPDKVFWDVLRNSCGDGMKKLPNDVGEIKSVEFWPKLFNVDGVEANSRYVEPDVLLTTDKYHIIIEAKKNDGGGQYEQQWRKEIQALLVDPRQKNQKIILIAMGGNNEYSYKSLSFKYNNSEVVVDVYKSSWNTLLDEIVKKKGRYGRIAFDIEAAMNKHGYFQTFWLASLSEGMKPINEHTLNLFEKWTPEKWKR